MVAPAIAERVAPAAAGASLDVEDVSHGFDIDPFAKHCLLNGVDELDYTLSLMDRISQFERGYDG